MQAPKTPHSKSRSSAWRGARHPCGGRKGQTDLPHARTDLLACNMAGTSICRNHREKTGTGVIPIAGKSFENLQAFGQDRFFVEFRIKSEPIRP